MRTVFVFEPSSRHAGVFLVNLKLDVFQELLLSNGHVLFTDISVAIVKRKSVRVLFCLTIPDAPAPIHTRRILRGAYMGCCLMLMPELDPLMLISSGPIL